MFCDKLVASLSSASLIRAMFEQGNKLKAEFGADNVYDFALGNPDPDPTPNLIAEMKQIAEIPGVHKYMSNAGFDDVRTKVANYINGKANVGISKDEIVMVTGAAAGLSVVFHSILNPGEEVITLAPYFMEYNSYVSNNGGKVVPVRTLPNTFLPDLDAIDKAINENTKALIVNSPNNPTGVVYSEDTIKALADTLKKASLRVGHPIYLISDEPYVKVIYDGVVVPEILKYYDDSIVVNSFSKSLALPGERIGYIAVNPRLGEHEILMQVLVTSNRTLGFVNAPALFQKLIADHLEESVGLDAYRERRDILYRIITEAGFECVKPEGAFYLFPKCPIADDKKFAELAIKHHIVLVGGAGFGYPGYFRLAYCVSKDTIVNSEAAFKALYKEATSL